MTSLLITGGQGYIGSTLVRQLVARGVRVTVVDNGLVPGARISGPRVTYVDGDIREPGEWQPALRGVDAVIHLAAVVGDPACGLDTDLAWQTNYLGTVRVAEACQKAGVGAFVFASTCSNYGATENDEEVDVWSPLNPQSVYAQSKIMAEHYLLSLGGSALTAHILRFATVHGLSDRMRFDLAVNVMTAHAVTRGEVVVHGGRQWRPFLHVQDAARALQTATDNTSPTLYNCGSGEENYRMAQIGEVIAREVPGTRVLVQEDAEDPRNYRVNFERIREARRFQRRFGVVDSVREIRDAMTRGRYPDFADAKYSNFLTARNALAAASEQAAARVFSPAASL
ncbi:epimerase [Streptomyces litmocidini]|uniref:NAD-dependent epimerase/dehydratase family protein n=1 Tax=Streptomyces litmocidini TaxID=67318 RepID=UPI00167D1C24|nr:SDR family oxidoreductase [Streptomyces litmocidini]GGU80577.1 epimerase [Streptomyces litmocidini]